MKTLNLMYVRPCIVYESDERYQLDASCVKLVPLVTKILNLEEHG